MLADLFLTTFTPTLSLRGCLRRQPPPRPRCQLHRLLCCPHLHSYPITIAALFLTHTVLTQIARFLLEAGLIATPIKGIYFFSSPRMPFFFSSLLSDTSEEIISASNDRYHRTFSSLIYFPRRSKEVPKTSTTSS